MSLKTKISLGILKLFNFPEIPKNPKAGKWYRISLPQCIRSDGESIHAGLRIGKENKLMILFHCIGISSLAEKLHVDGVTVLQWLTDAAKGKTYCVGLGLLDQY